MKSNFTKQISIILLFFIFSCKTVEVANETTNSNNFLSLNSKIVLDSSQSEIKKERPNTVTSKIITKEDLTTLYWSENKEELNPKYSSRTESLDNIFNPDALGQIVLVFDRSEWNKHLDYCDININHEENVVAKGFYFTKDNKEWFFKDIGFRVRGNTSRRRPQKGNGMKKNDYVQSHFALDFEEWLTDEQEESGVEKKLADCMKGVILKRFKDDATYSREIYSYNLFRQNGIWLSPRASYTRLIIQIQDDLDLDKDGDTTEFESIDYGIYGMIEEIKKQFLKERTLKEGGGYLSSNKGNLWKCLYKAGSGTDFVLANIDSMGEESCKPVKNKKGKIVDFSINNYSYDYKGDNEFLDGTNQIKGFMYELNNLPNCNDGKNDEEDKLVVKKFYTQRMAGDLFLRTYAINVILGMWDDYWINKNNFYFYFDKDGKAYFIPYDYDNVLGVSHLGIDAGKQNPINWGSLNSRNRPLIQKILQVPEFMDLYKKYLIEYSNEDSFFDDDNSIAQIKKWHSMIEPFINSSNLIYRDTTDKFIDKPADWGDTYKPYTVYTEGKLNYFTVRQETIQNYAK